MKKLRNENPWTDDTYLKKYSEVMYSTPTEILIYIVNESLLAWLTSK